MELSDDKIDQIIREAYQRGYQDGVTLNAVWKEGTQVVGIFERPLKEVINPDNIQFNYNYTPPNLSELL